MTQNLLHTDNWLSGHLGYPVSHLLGSIERLKQEDLPIGAAFIDVKVDVGSVEQIHHLEKLGFRLIDTNVQLIRKSAPINVSSDRCRFATSNDENAVRRIARHSFSHSRFHLDPLISNSTANRIKSAWAGNFFSGLRGEWMVVAEENDEVCGFLQLLRNSADNIVIDLIAVSKEQQGHGLASAMIAFASHSCLNRQATIMVGTQIANVPSLALYTRLGFQISSCAYVFHLHQKN